MTAPRSGHVQPLSVRGESKELAWSTLDATGEAILSEGVATPDELAAALASLRQYTDDQTTLIARPRIFQLWSAREPT
jgi:hypothetical protein